MTEHHDTADTPDSYTEVYAEPIRAHRFWFLNPDKMELRGMNGFLWESGLMEARCAVHNHESPYWPSEDWSDHQSIFSKSTYPEIMPVCYCGVNAYKLTTPIPQTYEPGPTEILVHGIVDLGGNVHEYELGYRAQYGLIREAMILSDIPFGFRFTNYLEQKYEAPFRVMLAREWLEEWEATYGRDRESDEENSDAETTSGAGSKKDSNQRTNQGASQGTIPGQIIRQALAQAVATSVSGSVSGPYYYLDDDPFSKRPSIFKRVIRRIRGLGGGFAVNLILAGLNLGLAVKFNYWWNWGAFGFLLGVLLVMLLQTNR